MGVNGGHARLPCGTDLLALVQQVSDGLPPADPEHQAGCVHCRRSLARIRSTLDDVRGLASERVVAPPDLARRVMRRLRGEQARVAVSASARGRTSVNQAIVAQVAQRAALDVPEVVFASALMTDPEAGGSVRVEVRLVVAYGPALERVAGAVREHIIGDVAAVTGLLVEDVDVRIDDLS